MTDVFPSCQAELLQFAHIQSPHSVLCLCPILQDLSNKDMKRDLYIISQVIRTGKIRRHTGGNVSGLSES